VQRVHAASRWRSSTDPASAEGVLSGVEYGIKKRPGYQKNEWRQAEPKHAEEMRHNSNVWI